MIKVKVVDEFGKDYTSIITKNAFTIGRSSTCDFPVPMEDISINHCFIEWDGSSFSITDLGSTNGVFIDSQRIPPNTKTNVHVFLNVLISNKYSLSVEESETDSNLKFNVLNTKKNNKKENLTQKKSFILNRKNLNPKAERTFKIISVLLFLLMSVIFYYTIIEQEKNAPAFVQEYMEHPMPVRYEKAYD